MEELPVAVDERLEEVDPPSWYISNRLPAPQYSSTTILVIVLVRGRGEESRKGDETHLRGPYGSCIARVNRGKGSYIDSQGM